MLSTLLVYIHDYNDCLLVMKEVRKELNKQGLGDVKVMVQIQCGESKRLQEWSEQFWQLVDNSLVPPELFIGDKLTMNSAMFRQQIYSKNQVGNIENHIIFYPDEDKFTRCLNIVEKEVPHV